MPLASVRRAAIPLLYAVASGFVLASFLLHWGPKLGVELQATLAFDAPRPYVYRILSPLIVRGLVGCVPEAWTPALVALVGKGLGPAAAARLGVSTLSAAYVVSTWLMLASLTAAALVWRALIRWALPGRPGLADAVPALALLLLPATFTGGGFLYDFPELALVSACMLAFVRRRWAWWYALLPLAVLNKEASALVVVWWLAAQGSMPTRAWWTHAVASAAIAGGVVGALWWRFRGADGFVAQPNFAHNVRYWASLRWLIETSDGLGLGLPLPVGPNLFNLAVAGLVVTMGRRRVPSEVARAFTWAALAVLPLLLAFGFESEIRVFASAAPALVVLGAGAVDAMYPTAAPGLGVAEAPTAPGLP